MTIKGLIDKLITVSTMFSVISGITVFLLGGFIYESGNLMGASNYLSVAQGLELFMIGFLISIVLTSALSFGTVVLWAAFGGFNEK